MVLFRTGVLLALLAPAGLALQQPLLQVESLETESEFGGSLAAAGDVDGDGLADLVIGSPPSLQYRGAARVVSSADGSTLYVYDNAVGQQSDRLGQGVAGCGDLDGDGLAEFAVGMPMLFSQSLGGRVRVYRGSDGSVLHGMVAPVPDEALGWALANVGDIDGDGLDDLAVGAPQSNLAAPDAGAVYILSGANGVAIQTLAGPPASWQPAQLGTSVAAAGDMNLDGAPDIVVGAPFWAVDQAGIMSGAVTVFAGGTGQTLLHVTGASPDRLGWSVAGGLDVDGGGVPDIVAGAPQIWPGPAVDKGYARVWSGESGAPLATFTGSYIGDHTGWSVALADVNLDGRADAVVGEPEAFQIGVGDCGRVRVFSGDGFGLLADVRGEADEKLGSAVAVLGDLDGDLAAEWAAGAPFVGSIGDVRLFASMAAWDDLGHAMPGHLAPLGLPSHVCGSGPLLAGTTLQLSLKGGKDSGSPPPAVLIVGASALLAPFQGGVLVPSPDLLVAGLSLDTNGSLNLQGTWPAGVPSGFALWMQIWMPNPQGVGASNGLMLTTP